MEIVVGIFTVQNEFNKEQRSKNYIMLLLFHCMKNAVDVPGFLGRRSRPEWGVRFTKIMLNYNSSDIKELKRNGKKQSNSLFDLDKVFIDDLTKSSKKNVQVSRKSTSKRHQLP